MPPHHHDGARVHSALYALAYRLVQRLHGSRYLERYGHGGCEHEGHSSPRPARLKEHLAVVTGLCLLAACSAPTSQRRVPFPQPAREPEIDTLAMKAQTYFLAHDLLAGRGAGTPGAALAAVYIASACQALGLSPVAGSDFMQEIPLVESRVQDAALVVQQGERTATFRYPADFLPDLGGEQALEGLGGSARYGGSPLALGRLDSLEGAVVVTASGLPDWGLVDSLARRGARALLQLVPDSSLYDLYRRSRGPRRLALAEPGIPMSLVPGLPWIVAGPRLARTLGFSATAANAVQEPPGPLAANIRLEVQVERRAVSSENVACLLRGAAPGARDTAIVLAAHYDHLGIGAPDIRGDSIYNGFSDNAAGVAAVLAVARAMVKGEDRPWRHSVIFFFPTAEEYGLLGSDYYVARPLWPLARTAGVITLDAGAPPGAPTSWRIAGGDHSRLGMLALDVALARGFSATTSPATPNSDYYPFVRSGVPGILLVPGPGPYEGLTSDSSVALRRAFEHYHQPADAWLPTFPFRGLARYAEYAYLVARALDRGGEAEEGHRVRRR